MKTLLKIAAIAAITALAVISCSPPEVPEAHFDWWDQYNEQFDASKYTDNINSYFVDASDINTPNGLTAYADSWTGDKQDNIVTITFKPEADILKNVSDAKLKEFVSFNTYDPAEVLGDYGVSTLTAITGWQLERQIGNTLYIKLPNFSTTYASHIVIKIDGTKYTYSNGLKADKDGNGIPGEAGYDDLYKTLNISGISRAYPSLITDLGLSASTAAISYKVYADNKDTKTVNDITVADYNTAISYLRTEDRDTILKQIAGGFKIEQFSGGKWSATSAKVSYDSSTPSKGIYADTLTLSDMTGYRVVFEKGSINLVTDKAFYGLKQRIRIADSSWYPTKTIFNVLKNVTRVEGYSSLYYNTDKRDTKDFNGDSYLYDIDYYTWYPGYIEDDDWDILTDGPREDPNLLWNRTPTTTAPTDNHDGWIFDPSSFWIPHFHVVGGSKNVDISIYSQDSYKGNIVLKLLLNVPVSKTTGAVTTNYYFKQLDLSTLKSNFKIYKGDTQLTNEISIEKVEYNRERLPADTAISVTSGYNVIYITLDPNYRQNDDPKIFYISDGFVYADGITLFSGNDIWKDKGVGIYNIGGSYF